MAWLFIIGFYPYYLELGQPHTNGIDFSDQARTQVKSVAKYCGGLLLECFVFEQRLQNDLTKCKTISYKSKPGCFE